jgi:hypothetical protein
MTFDGLVRQILCPFYFPVNFGAGLTVGVKINATAWSMIMQEIDIRRYAGLKKEGERRQETASLVHIPLKGEGIRLAFVRCDR